MKLQSFQCGLLCVAVFTSFKMASAQIPFSTHKEKTETRNGNKEYQKQNYAEAETDYRKALDVSNNMPQAVFNLGDAVYEQKRYDDAQKQFQLSAKMNAGPLVKAHAYHNLGNSFLEQKKWDDAIGAYKSALKLNPTDHETKYNLAYANAMKQQNEGGGGQDKKNQDQKDQQDKKDQQQKQDHKNQDQQKDQNQQQQANNQDKKDQQRQQQQQKSKLSKKDADQLLAALENEEQKTNQKMQKQQMKAVRVRIKKDW